MPDPNNPTDPSQNPPAPTGMGMPPTMPEPTVTAEIPPLPASDTTPPPDAGAPIPPDSQPVEGMAPQDISAGSAAPSFDIPPVVTPGQPKKKFGGKRVIATILGLLVLVGGLGAGLILVRQQQDIREKAGGCTAAGDCIPTKGGTCCSGVSYLDKSCSTPSLRCEPNPPKCTADGDCIATKGGTCCSGDSYSDKSCSTPSIRCGTKPEESPPPDEKQCSRVNQVFTDHNAASITISKEMVNECTNKCPKGEFAGKLWVAKYKCDGINLSQGCQDNGEIVSQDAQLGQTFSASSPTCGTIQIDVGCKNPVNTYGTVGGVSKGASQACSTPPTSPGPTQNMYFCKTSSWTCSQTSSQYTNDAAGISQCQANLQTYLPGQTTGICYSSSSACDAACNPPASPTPTAQCLNIKAYDTNWVPLKAEDLAKLKPGDKVRFTVSGTTTGGGTFDKARFKINGVQRPEVTQKKSGTDEFYDEYTIPGPRDITTSINTFTINAQIHHSILGWSL